MGLRARSALPFRSPSGLQGLRGVESPRGLPSPWHQRPDPSAPRRERARGGVDWSPVLRAFVLSIVVVPVAVYLVVPQLMRAYGKLRAPRH